MAYPKPKRDRAPTPFQRRVVMEYLVPGTSARAAYERAGGGKKNAGAHGPRLLRLPHVRKLVEAEFREVEAEIKLRASDVAQRVYEQSMALICDAMDKDGAPLPLDKLPELAKRAMIRSKTVFENQDMPGLDEKTGRQVMVKMRVPKVAEIELANRVESQRLFLQYAGKLKEKVELTGKDDGPLVIEVVSLADRPAQ